MMMTGSIWQHGQQRPQAQGEWPCCCSSGTSHFSLLVCLLASRDEQHYRIVTVAGCVFLGMFADWWEAA